MTGQPQVRELAARTRGEVESSFDVEAGLAGLRAAARSRRRAYLVAAAAAVVTVLGVTGVVVNRPAPPPAPAGPSTPDASPRPASGSCGGSPVSVCRHDRTVAVEADAFSWSVPLPRSYGTDLAVDSAPQSVDLGQRRHPAALTVLVDVSPARHEASIDEAEDLAAWVAGRPHLSTSGPTPTTVSGYPAWRVTARLESGYVLPETGVESCNSSQGDCVPLLVQEYSSRRWEVGLWQGMDATFTFVDAPGDELLVLWSWAYHGDARALATNERLVADLTIQPR